MADFRASIYPFSFTKTSDATQYHFQQIDSQAFSTNGTKSSVIPGGALDVSHTGLASAMPTVSMSTRDLTTAFTHMSASAATPFTLGVGRFQRRADGAEFEGGANNDVIDIPKGALTMQSLSAAQADTEGAICNFNMNPLYDGTNAIMSRQTSVNFATAPAPAFTSRFFFGPVAVNGTLLDGLIRTQIDFGIAFNRKAYNGDTFPKCGGIYSRNPTITLVTEAINATALLDMFMRVLGGALDCYFQAGVQGGDRVAKATASHLRVSAAAGTWCDDQISVSGNEDSTVNIMVTPTGSLTSTLSVAIPV